jgi:hypothetical protein
MPEFIDEEIEVSFERKPGPPAAFTWRGVEHRIVEIEQQWQAIDRRREWWQRRHRDRYIVRTAAGERYEIYYHRGYGRRYWMLFRRLDE